MSTAFIFGGALTAIQEKCVRESKGSLVHPSDDLSGFDVIVTGLGVKVPATDENIKKMISFSGFLSSMKEQKRKGKKDA